MLLKSHWDPRILWNTLFIHLYNLSILSEKVEIAVPKSILLSLGPTSEAAVVLDHSKTYRLPLHFYFKVGGGL